MARVKTIGPQAPISLDKAASPAPPAPPENKQGKPYSESFNFPASSHLASAVWFSNGVLYIRFRGPEFKQHPGGNSTYRYTNIRKRLWDGLKSAGSAGKYFHKYIRLSKQYERQ